MTLSVTPSECRKILSWNIRAGITTMIKGKPSTAKSAVVRQLAADYNLFLIDQRVSQLEPEDLQGLPRINPQTGKAEYVPFDWIPLEGDPLPKGYDGWLLFLDELNAGEKPVTKAAYKLVLDKMCGQRKLHPRCAVVACGNLDTDGALVEDMGTAMQSRMSYLTMEVDAPGFLEYAAGAGFDHRIRSFIRFKPALLHTFDPEKASLDSNYACHRTWEFTHRQLQQVEQTSNLDDPLALVAFAGSLGEGVAREFLAFCKLDGKLPDISEIVKSPQTVPVPQEPGALYALTGHLAQYTTGQTVEPVMEYVHRIPKEFQVITLREIGMCNKEVYQTGAVGKWISDNALELF